MSTHESRSSSKWNAIRSKVVPSNVTANADSSLLNPGGDKSETEKRKGVPSVRLYRSPGSFKSSVPHSSSCK